MVMAMSDIRKRRLGRTDFMATEIGLGGIPLMRVADLDEAAALISYGVDQGINYIDTARCYADSEKKIGLVMKDRRDEVFLATKTNAYDYDTASQYLETSLAELQTDHLDLWQMHDISSTDRFDLAFSDHGAMKAAHEALDQGLIRHIGVSSHNDHLVARCIETDEFDVILVAYNLAISSAAQAVFPVARAYDVGVTVMKPLSGGVFFRREETYVDPMEAWHFVLMNEDVAVALAGFQNQRDIDQALHASATLRPIAADRLEELVARARYLGEDVCRACGYCRECPAGLDLPRLMQIADEARVFSYEWPRFRREYASMDPKVDACTDCGQCEEKCPFDLPVRERIRKVQKHFGAPV